MKTPTLLLALAAALPFAVSAQPAAPAGRCRSERLAKLAQGYIGADDQKILKSETAEGAGARQVIDIAAMPDLCDATVWRYLVLKNASGQPGVFWRDEGLKAAWSGDFTQQAKMLQTVDDVYRTVDAQGPAVLAAGDAVVDAAVKMGVVARKDGASPAALAANGMALAKFANEKAYAVEAVDAKTAATPAELKASLSRLLADAPAPKVKKGQAAPAPVVIPGPAVLEFRKAVMGLASDLGILASTNKLSASRGAIGMKGDFAPGAAGVFAAFAKLKTKDGRESYPDSSALDDKAYAGALKYVTDPAITDAADDAPHDGAALSRLDYALRNLIALRAAAVDQAVAAARKRLNGRSVKETLAGVARDEKAAAPRDPKAAPEPAAGSLGAQVLERLKGTKEYSELNSFYDNKSKADPAWAETAEGKSVAAQMKTMRDDAAATTVGRTPKGMALQYTVGGQKVTDTGIVVADLNSDKEYRDFIASAVASNIATDGKVQAFLGALRGQGAPGTPVAPPLDPKQQQTADAGLPPAQAKPAPAPASPWEALVKATPSAGFFGWFSSKETAERYAAHENEAAAELASNASRARDQKQRELNWQGAAADRQAKFDEDRRVAAAAAKAKRDEEGIRQAPQDPDLSPAEAERRQKEAIAAREKASAEEQAKIRADAAAAKAARDAEAAKTLKAAQDAAAKAEAEASAKRKALDETVNKAYDDGVVKAEAELHGAYKKPGDDRRSAAEKLSGYTGQFYRVERVDKFFADAWEGDKLPAATAACKTKLGFKMPVNSGEGFKDPNADNVDGYCGVRTGLVAHLNSYRGSVKPPAPAAAPAGK